MALSNHAFLIIAILGVIGMMNNGEPISDLTLNLILFILPGTMIMSLYMMGGFNRVLNSRTTKNNHGSEHNEDTNS